MKKLFFFISLFVSLVSFGQQQLNPVTWKVTYLDLPNGEGEITFTAIIEKKWHIYSQKVTVDGPIPTSFVITPSKEFKLVGVVTEDNAHEIYDKSFEAKLYVFDNQAVFKQKIKRTGKTAFVIKTSLEFMTCNDAQCLPPKTLTFDITVPKIF